MPKPLRIRRAVAMAERSRLCLVRHGATAFTEAGRYCGHSDPPLSGAGIEQIRTLRARLAPRLNDNLAVFSSDLRRAIQTATLLLAAPFRQLPSLREIHFGDWEGKNFEDTGCTAPETLLDPTFHFPNGESQMQLQARVAQAWHETIAPALADRVVVVVAHAGSLAALRLLLHQLPPREFWNYLIPHAEALWVRHE